MLQLFKNIFQKIQDPKDILKTNQIFDEKKLDSNLRSQFPFFENNPNIYLDSAASAQKPQAVINSLIKFYSKDYSNNHGSHNLAAILNQKIDQVRIVTAKFVNAKSSSEIIFTSGATESFNLLSSTLTVPKHKTNLLICIAEHHSNMLPWQELAKENNLEIRYFGLDQNGTVDLVDFESKLDSQTFLVAISHCSNVLGIINDIKTICSLASKNDALSVIDATQSIVHTSVDVQDLNCDFLAFSGHKLYGPTGIGVLYGNFNLLDDLRNYKLGGEMVELVTKETNFFKASPFRFEAGTANLEGIIGLGEAIKWFESNRKDIINIETRLFEYLKQQIKNIADLQTIVPIELPDINQSPILSFWIKDIDCYDLAQYLYLQNIAIRDGHHCTGPLHEYLRINSSLRISLACYNTEQDIDTLIDELKKAIKILSKKNTHIPSKN